MYPINSLYDDLLQHDVVMSDQVERGKVKLYSRSKRKIVHIYEFKAHRTFL